MKVRNISYLIDDNRGKTVNLREDSSYSFTPTYALTNFSVVVGKNENIEDRLNAVVLPKQFTLGRNYPNPFNPETIIPVALPRAANITLKVYNILGKEVKTIYQAPLEAGRHLLSWDGKNEIGNDVVTGVYLYRFTTGTGVSLSGKMILLR